MISLQKLNNSLFLGIFIAIFLLVNITALKGQEVFYHISNSSLYDFLDEMANSQLIDLNTAIKPYSRSFISSKLYDLEKQKEQLNERQIRDLKFFLKDFNKELKPDKDFSKRFDILYYKDSLFTFSINPILGIQYWTNNNGSATHWWNGAEAFAYIGKHWGFYASLRDNHDEQFLSRPEYITQRMGANYKGNGDYSEMRGGISYSWDWGSAGLIKDHFTWGNNYNGSNIFSGRTPSVPQIYLRMKPVKWFEFSYTHAWLVSEVVDSTRSYWTNSSYGMEYREVYHPRYIATNLFTFTPVEKLNLSFGNSIVYTDLGVYPGYLIPLVFFKSIDHSTNHGIDNQNSQLFFDVSSRNIKNLHLYSSLFIDELATSRIFNPEESNFYSWKIGGRLSNFPLQNISLTIEYTRSNPLTFQHYMPTLEFESNKFNLGHYLEDNSQELYISIAAKPLRGLYLHASLLFAQKGPDYDDVGGDRLGLPFIETVEWENKSFSFLARYEIINDAFLILEFQNSNISGNDLTKYTHPMWHGKTSTFSTGINFGF